MTERETEFDFDFFEDEETREPSETQRVRVRRRGPVGPPQPPTLTPLLRLAGLVAFAIVLVVLLVFWVSSCGGSGKEAMYQSYMKQVGVIAKDSAVVGRQLSDYLTTPGVKVADVAPKIDGLAQQEAQNVARARAVDPPPRLRLEQQHLVEALEFRVSGLRGLAQTFRQTVGQKDVATAGQALAAQADRLVASDVVWQDLFRTPAQAELKADGVTGVTVPASVFVPNPEFADPRSMVPIVQRLSGASAGGTPGGLHGTGLIGVKALPSGKALDPTNENIVTANTDLGFVATVKDTGDGQEVGIKVTLTIQQQPKPIVKTQTIDVIDPGQEKTVTFKNLGAVQFTAKTIVKVDVAPVPGEKNLSNNSAQYPVIFSLG